MGVTAVVLEGDRRRRVAVCAGTFALSFLIYWFAAGQGLSNLDDFARGAAEIMGGYSAAMQAHLPSAGWDRRSCVRMRAINSLATKGLVT